MDTDIDTFWSIGELACAAGLTVRTLHHYEQCGLMAPPGEGYSAADVERLYRIRALRELGLPMEAIGAALVAEPALPDLIEAQLARAEGRIAHAQRLRDRLLGLRSSPLAENALAVMAAMGEVERHAHACPDPWPDAPHRREEQWRSVVRRLRGCLRDGVAPGDPRARTLAVQARVLLREFTGGDALARQALATLRHEPPGAETGWDAALFRYLDRALAALDAN
jgi:DNA-binding transcriptional MerR regulator